MEKLLDKLSVVHRCFGFHLWSFQRSDQGRYKSILSPFNIVTTIFWFSLILYCAISSNFGYTIQANNLIKSNMSEFGGTLQIYMNLVIIAGIIMPGWFLFNKRKSVLECLAKVEVILNEVNCLENQKFMQRISRSTKAILFLIKFVSLAYFTLLSMLAWVTYSQISQRYDFTSYMSSLSAYWYEYLYMLDFIPIMLRAMQLFNKINGKLFYINKNC